MMKKLNEISDNNPFKVPENYFEEVNRKIISTTAGNEIIPVKKGSHRLFSPLLAIAASVAVLILLSYTAVKIFGPGMKEDKIPEMSMQEYYELYFYTDLNTLESKVESLINYEEQTHVSNSAIIEQLLLENINENDIYELI